VLPQEGERFVRDPERAEQAGERRVVLPVDLLLDEDDQTFQKAVAVPVLGAVPVSACPA
jgi:hypothetical protein